MKITIEGTTTDNKGEKVELTIELVDNKFWMLKLGKIEAVFDNLEKSMQFLKQDIEKS